MSGCCTPININGVLGPNGFLSMRCDSGCMDNFLDLARNRRSRRDFSSRPVEFEKVIEVVRAATYAPNVGDMQPWHFIVVSDSAIKDAVCDHCPHQSWMQNAPVLIVACGSIGKVQDFYDQLADRWLTQTVAAAVQNALLAAEEIGLGACWVSSFDEINLRDLLKIPDGHRPEVVIALGYSSEMPRDKVLLPLDQVIYLNSFGGKVTEMAAVLRDWGEHFRGKKDSFVASQQAQRVDEGEKKSFSDHAQSFFKKAKKPFDKKE